MHPRFKQTWCRVFGPMRVQLCQAIAVFVLSLGCCSGCGYAVGSAYQAEIRTIEVPIFTSDSYRRGMEYQLTEAVQRAIKRRTPFRIVKGPGADTRLTGHVVEVQKYLLGRSGFGDARELQVTLDVHVTWEDLRSGEILRRQRIPIEPELVPFRAQAEFAPEVGQSFATATQLVVENLAAQVVEMMEQPW